MFEDFFAALCYFQPVKEVAVIDFLAFFSNFILKEAADHKLIERFAEAPRPRYQVDYGTGFDQRFESGGLVDVVMVVFNQCEEGSVSNGN